MDNYEEFEKIKEIYLSRSEAKEFFNSKAFKALDQYLKERIVFLRDTLEKRALAEKAQTIEDIRFTQGGISELRHITIMFNNLQGAQDE